MPVEINDEFSALPMSRQQKYQLRKRRDGRCVTCGKPSDGKTHCAKHRTFPKTDPVKKECWSIFRRALQTGEIQRGRCWCGELGQGHHADYSKPLDVTWLCHRHHMDAHGRNTCLDRPVRIADVREYQLNYYRSRYEKTLTEEQRARLTAKRSRKSLAK